MQATLSRPPFTLDPRAGATTRVLSAAGDLLAIFTDPRDAELLVEWSKQDYAESPFELGTSLRETSAELVTMEERVNRLETFHELVEEAAKTASVDPSELIQLPAMLLVLAEKFRPKP